MAKTKSKAATRLGRDSQPKYLGVKLHEGQRVKPGMVIIRQRGTRFVPGTGVGRGKDDTLFALKKGAIKFSTKRKMGFNRSQRIVKVVNVNTAS